MNIEFKVNIYYLYNPFKDQKNIGSFCGIGNQSAELTKINKENMNFLYPASKNLRSFNIIQFNPVQ